MGIDGEAIEFECKIPRIFAIMFYSRDPARLASGGCVRFARRPSLH